MTPSAMLSVVLVTLVVAAVGSALMLRWGRLHLLDHPNARSSHTIPTPRGGGIGVLVGIAVGAWLGKIPLAEKVAVPVALLAVLSLVDDLRPLPSRFRLMAHLGIAVLALYLIGGYRVLVIPGIGSLTTPAVVTMLSVVWLVGLTNAFNFMDGINGIAAGQAIVAGAAWAVLGWWHDLPGPGWSGALIAGATLAFLPYNFPKARLFLGDVGSAPLGLLLGLLPFLAAVTSRAADWAASAGVLVVWPFLFDTLYTLARRARRGERLFEAHRSHLYQRLVMTGWSHTAVTAVYGGLATINALAAVALSRGSPWWSWGTAIGTAVLLLSLVRIRESQSSTGSVS